MQTCFTKNVYLQCIVYFLVMAPGTRGKFFASTIRVAIVGVFSHGLCKLTWSSRHIYSTACQRTRRRLLCVCGVLLNFWTRWSDEKMTESRFVFFLIAGTVLTFGILANCFNIGRDEDSSSSSSSSSSSEESEERDRCHHRTKKPNHGNQTYPFAANSCPCKCVIFRKPET